MRHTDDEEIIAAVLRAVDHLGLAEKIVEQALAGPEGRRLARKVLTLASDADLEAKAKDAAKHRGLRGIIAAASYVFGVPVEDITGRSRDRMAFRARAACALVARRIGGWSYPEIGRAVCRDHTTVIAAEKSAIKMEKQGDVFRERVGLVADMVGGASCSGS